MPARRRPTAPEQLREDLRRAATRYVDVFREWGREGGKIRAKKLTAKEREAIASKGGRAAAGKLTLTAAQRRERARKAAQARWRKKREGQ